MIVIALGSNLAGPWGTPQQSIEQAFLALNEFPLRLLVASTPIVSKPFGVANQPDFVNAVAVIATALSPHALLRRLHQIESRAGRRRRKRWGPRTLDLDLIDYNGRSIRQRGRLQKALVVPHPEIANRTFVLAPLGEIAPRWRHPHTRKSAATMLSSLTH